MKQRYAKGRECQCPEAPDVDSIIRAVCSEGRCVELRCPACGRWFAGWGPMGCKCSGYVRSMCHPDMAPQDCHAPVKPSLPPGRRKPKPRAARASS
jgi:hypothetical protein